MKRLQVYLVLVATSALAAVAPVNFDALLANPRAYHHKQISVIGYARVDGESFVLFKTKMAAEQLDDSHAVSVAQRMGEPTKDRFNNRWVKITGTVDANAHGLWNFRCEILLEKVEVADPPARSRTSR